MAKFHGRLMRVYVDGYDISGYTNSVEVTNEADIVDVAGFGDAKKNYVVGLTDSQVNIAGFFDDTAGSGIHALLSQRLGSTVNFLASMGTAPGAYGFSGSAELESAYSLAAAINAAVTVKAKIVNQGSSIVPVQLAQGPTTASGTQAAFDTGTATNNGGRAYVQNFGGGVNQAGSVRLEGGTDVAFGAGGTVLLADFGTMGSAGGSAQGIAFSGTFPRYVRVNAYSGTPNIAVSFFRN